MGNFLIYGSYGYTGQLIVDHAIKKGLHPILAGRDEKQLRAQAEQYNLDYRAFSLDETAKLDSALLEVDAVLHCAGPFVHTYRHMAEACLRTKRHYVDISGEIPGFEALAAMDVDRQEKQALCFCREVGLMLFPPIVLPRISNSDCHPPTICAFLCVGSVRASRGARQSLQSRICTGRG